MVHHTPFFQDLHISKGFFSWTNSDPPMSIKCIFFSITSSASHILSEKHTHRHSDTKWDLSSIIWEFVTKLTLSSYLIIAFKLWYMTQCVGTEAGTLTTIYLPLISRSSVRKETIMEDKHINSNLFHHSHAEIWNKRSFTSRQVFRSIACLCTRCLHAETKWLQLLSQLQPIEKILSQHWNSPNSSAASCGK